MVFTLKDLNARGQVKVARHAVVNTSPIPPWRWIAVIAVLAGLAHARLDARLGGPDFADMLERHGS